MAQSLSKIHIRMNAFALPGRTNENTINTQGVASLALGYAQPWAFSPPHLPFVASSSQDLRMMISRLMTSLRSVGLRTSLPPCGQWGYAESREIRVLKKSASVSEVEATMCLYAYLVKKLCE
ncbi:hypothetical protein [Hallella sp.]|uniref:hypothetical protein n=1 Tax=Hallella sp. TaxID=2980186 RepID=UPI00307C011C